MRETFVIRKVKSEDAREYVELQNLIWRDAYSHIFPEEVFVDRESNYDKRIKWIENFKNDDKQIGYVAVVNDKIVGLMNAVISSDYEYFKNKGYSELMILYIHPDYQGVGIGSSFKKIFVDWAIRNGSTKFVIGVLADNVKARKVYEKWGGKLDDYTQPFVKLGVCYKEVFYTYDLKV